MKKYYIGFLVLAVITLGLTGYVIKLGADSKSDKKTESAAQDIAKKLNEYVETKRKVPNNLTDAGVASVPSEIKYTKNSEMSYSFCVTYKTNRGYGGGVNISSIVSGAVSSSLSSAFKDSTTDYKPTALYLSYIHKKGENCQTVQPVSVISTSESPSSTSSSSTQSLIDEYCNPSAEYYQYYKSYCEDLPSSSVN